MSQELLTASTHQSSIAVLATGSTLDESCVEPLMNRIRRLVADGADIVVFDCANLEYITSFGLSVFLRARKFLREAHGESRPAYMEDATGPSNGGSIPSNEATSLYNQIERVRLVNVSRHVQDILRTASLVQVLPVFDSIQDARQSLAI